MARFFIISIFLAFSANIAMSQSFENQQKAVDLGALLASEDLCHLSYDRAAIEHWIDENVDPSDMSFPADLNAMTEGAKFEFGGMSASSKAAHCRAVTRTAKHFGFLKD